MITKNSGIMNGKLYTMLLLVLAITSCVEEFRPELDEFENLLVVDGRITNEDGPYTISLSISSGLDIIKQEPVENAIVTIKEEVGGSEILTEIKPGIYETSFGGIKGMPGKSYKLIVSTNGQQYESDYELLKDPTPIASVEVEVEYKGFPDAPDIVPGYQFYINAAQSPYEQDYYLWTQEGTYKYKSDLIIVYIYEGGFADFQNHDSLQTCYRTYRVDEVFTTSTTNLATPEVIAHPLHFLPATDKKLKIRYSMLTRQYSVSKKAYDFWHGIEIQSSNSGSLYTAQPYQIRGNLKNINNPEEAVLGYFLVAGVSENRLFVNRPSGIEIFISQCVLDYEGISLIGFTSPDEWPFYITIGEEGLALSGNGCMDCRQLGGVLEKPWFWID
jgi:hypothetical protein